MKRLSHAILRFLRDPQGLSAVEFAFVAPVTLLILTAILEFGAMLFLQSNMMNVARDTARRLAVGQIETTQEATDFAQNNVINWGAVFTVNITEPDPADANGGDFTVVISVPAQDAALMNVFGILGSGNITARSIMKSEL